MRRPVGFAGLVVAAVGLAVVLGSRPAPPEVGLRTRHAVLPGPTAEEEAGLLEAPPQRVPTPAHPTAAAGPRGRPPRARSTPSRPGAPSAAHSRKVSTPRAAGRLTHPASEPRPEAGRSGRFADAVAPPRSGAPSEHGDTAGPAQAEIQHGGPTTEAGAQESPGREAETGRLDADAGQAAREPRRDPVPAETPAGAEPHGPAQRKPVLTPPRPVYGPAPEYPGLRVTVEPGAGFSSAAATRPEGRLRVRLLVRADGTVGAVELLVSSGDAELDRAAVSALSSWRFEPARRDGQPVDSYYVVWVAFRTVQQ